MNVELKDIQDDLRDDLWTRRVDGARRAAAVFSGGRIAKEDELALCALLRVAAQDRKWEVRKAAVLAIGETRHVELNEIRRDLEELVSDPNPWVRKAARAASERLAQRSSVPAGWELSATPSDPIPAYIASRIKEMGPGSIEPARIYDLVMELGEQFYKQLAAETAHEVRTLLTPLKGYLGVLERRILAIGANDSIIERSVHSSLDRVRQLETMIDQLDIYSAPADGDFERTSIAPIVDEAVRVGLEIVGGPHAADPVAGIERRVEIPASIVAEVLPERLRRAITNIVSNALHAMDGDGVLTVKAQMKNSESVAILVGDTGKGMTVEEADAALRRYHSTRKDQGGTGLGLPIAQRIIERDHGGQLSIESTPGKGTTVAVVLPIRRSKKGGV